MFPFALSFLLSVRLTNGRQSVKLFDTPQPGWRKIVWGGLIPACWSSFRWRHVGQIRSHIVQVTLDACWWTKMQVPKEILSQKWISLKYTAWAKHRMTERTDSRLTRLSYPLNIEETVIFASAPFCNTESREVYAFSRIVSKSNVIDVIMYRLWWIFSSITQNLLLQLWKCASTRATRKNVRVEMDWWPKRDIVMGLGWMEAIVT